jgi:hypothetical protein
MFYDTTTYGPVRGGHDRVSGANGSMARSIDESNNVRQYGVVGPTDRSSVFFFLGTSKISSERAIASTRIVAGSAYHSDRRNNRGLINSKNVNHHQRFRD